MERDEVIAVVLLALGVLAIANPAFMGMAEVEGEIELTAQEVEIDDFAFAELAGEMGDLIYVPDLVPVRSEQLTDEDRAIFDAAVGQGFEVQPGEEEAFEQYVQRTGLVLHDGSLLQPAFDEDAGLLTYQEAAGTIVVDLANRTADESPVLEEAIAGNESRVDDNASTLTAYDFVRDEEVFYALGFEETSDDERYLSVTEQSMEDVLISLERVGEIDDVPAEVRDEVAAAIRGEEASVSAEHQMLLQEVALIRYEGAFYQMQGEEVDPHITEHLEPYNYALMAAGLLLIATSMLYARRVYSRAKSDDSGEVRHVVTVAEEEGDDTGDDEIDDDGSEPEEGTGDDDSREPEEEARSGSGDDSDDLPSEPR